MRGVGGEGLSVGPFGCQGAVEALYLAVLPWAVWFDPALRSGPLRTNRIKDPLGQSEPAKRAANRSTSWHEPPPS